MIKPEHVEMFKEAFSGFLCVYLFILAVVIIVGATCVLAVSIANVIVKHEQEKENLKERER